MTEIIYNNIKAEIDQSIIDDLKNVHGLDAEAEILKLIRQEYVLQKEKEIGKED